MDENIYGTARFLRAIHIGLHQKYLAHSERIEQLWRSFTPDQRDLIFRAGLKSDQVLQTPDDKSLGASYAVVSEMNLHDIKSSPDYFLDHFEFRATTSLTEQYRTGLEGALGDHQVIMRSKIARNPEFLKEHKHELTFFMDEKRYGESFKAENQEKYKKVLNDFASAVQAGLCVPRGVGNLILERQCYMIKHLCILVEDILRYGELMDEMERESETPEQKAWTALSTYPVDIDPESVCVQDLLTAVYDRKSSFEVYWGLCRSNPVFLANAVNVWYSTRPDLVADEKGRRMPLASDEYVSRAIFEVIHNSIIGTAVWDIITTLLKNCLEASDDPGQGILLQEISNICHHEYDRIRRDFTRMVQVGRGAKHFKRLSNVFDNATPRVTLKNIPDRLQKEDQQLHYILRLCQPETDTTQAVRWITMLDQLHHKQPIELDRLEKREYNALGEIATTVNIINALIISLKLPSASPKKGVTYVSKLKELMARLDPLKILKDLEVQLQNVKETGKFKSKSKSKSKSKKSVGAFRPMSQVQQQGQAIKTHSSNSSRSSTSRISASEPRASPPSQIPTPLENPTKSKTPAEPETLIKADGSADASTPTQVKVLAETKSSTQPQEITEPSLSDEPVASAQETLIEPEFESSSRVPPVSPKPKKSVEMDTSTGGKASTKLSVSDEPEISINQELPTEPVTPAELEISEPKPITELETSAEPETPTDMANSTEAAAASEHEHEPFVGPDPYVQLTTSTIKQAISALDFGEAGKRPLDQPEAPTEVKSNSEHGTADAEQTSALEPDVGLEAIGREISTEAETSEALGERRPDLLAESETIGPEIPRRSDTPASYTEPGTPGSQRSIKANMERPIEQDSPTKSDVTEELPEVFKVQPTTLEVFTALFSALESGSNSDDAAPSIKWLAFGTAMAEIGFTIVPNIGSLYTFVPSENAEVQAYFTLHRPYREVIQGDSLVYLASRLKHLYGWGKETFEAA
ncbi:hypothetical protein TSTA_002810 [Talaromyces stipitatus ATCC 10500]|uniref:Uncharacterized protein n=1 Tax=Talaromyces stipitatus (strain ATCC 10500 / CBS 375.48 / QM 6759 / NRRL 1006) TaxID=441959 RepID=B8MS84_TALSN|nr:uncharacterized protein TSTA_002810 [Talaromyces stipitatus ATCC 10500]EED12217.1 hypothetical protein TSTA_002810 [Talaromyces stipitatus ATCC 10500]